MRRTMPHQISGMFRGLCSMTIPLQMRQIRSRDVGKQISEARDTGGSHSDKHER